MGRGSSRRRLEEPASCPMRHAPSTTCHEDVEDEIFGNEEPSFEDEVEEEDQEGLRIVAHPKNEEIYKEEIVRLREELKVASSRRIRRFSLR